MYLFFYHPIRKEGCLLPEYYSSGRDPRRTSGERPVHSAPRSQNGARPAPRAGAPRPQSSRPQNGRPQGNRPQGSRPAGNRPPQGRRPAPRRRKRTQPRFFVILAAIVIVLVLALVLILSGRGGDDIVVPQSTPVPASSNSGMSNATVSTQSDVNAEDRKSVV